MFHSGALAKFCCDSYSIFMRTINISLPDNLKSFVDQQASGRGYGTSSDYECEPSRSDRDRDHLRALLLKGAISPKTAPVDARYFDGLRARVWSQQPE